MKGYRYIDIDIARREDGLCDVSEVLKECRHDFDLGTAVIGTLVAEGVPHDYAMMLDREYTKRHTSDTGLFSVVATVSRAIDAWAIDNPELAESPRCRAIY